MNEIPFIIPLCSLTADNYPHHHSRKSHGNSQHYPGNLSFAVSFLAIGEPPVGSFSLMKPPDVGSLLLVRCCLVTEGKKQSLMLRTVTVIHIIEKVCLSSTRGGLFKRWELFFERDHFVLQNLKAWEITWYMTMNPWLLKNG